MWARGVRAVVYHADFIPIHPGNEFGRLPRPSRLLLIGRRDERRGGPSFVTPNVPARSRCVVCLSGIAGVVQARSVVGFLWAPTLDRNSGARDGRSGSPVVVPFRGRSAEIGKVCVISRLESVLRGSQRRGGQLGLASYQI